MLIYICLYIIFLYIYVCILYFYVYLYLYIIVSKQQMLAKNCLSIVQVYLLLKKEKKIQNCFFHISFINLGKRSNFFIAICTFFSCFENIIFTLSAIFSMSTRKCSKLRFFIQANYTKFIFKVLWIFLSWILLVYTQIYILLVYWYNYIQLYVLVIFIFQIMVCINNLYIRLINVVIHYIILL